MAASSDLRENIKLNMYRILTKDGATETGGVRGVGVYWEVCGSVGEVGMAPCIEYLPTRSLCPHCTCGLKGVGW